MGKKKPKRQKAATLPRFAIGDRVRVKRGVRDYDFPDIPIGGWAGTVKEIYQGKPPHYLIRWSQQTLDSVHPIYKKRCERDGLDYEEMGLGEDDLEPDKGEPVEIEQPTSIETKPLDMQDQDDRIPAVFGLTHDDLLPDADFETLRVYRDFLAGQLSFPFEADWESENLAAYSCGDKR